MKAGDHQAVLHPGSCLRHARHHYGSVDVGQRYSGIVRVDELRGSCQYPLYTGCGNGVASITGGLPVEKRRAPGGAQTHIPSPDLRKWQAPLRGHGRPEEPGVRGHEDVGHGHHLTSTGGNLTNKKDGSRRNWLKNSK
jgi:hypothetical protein